MKRIILLSLIFVLTFCACSPNGDVQNTNPGEPFELPEQMEIKGVYFIVNDNENLVITEDGTPILITIKTWEKYEKQLQNGDTVLFMCDELKETYPKQADAFLFDRKSDSINTQKVVETLVMLRDLGYSIDDEAFLEWTGRAFKIENLTENYEAIEKVCDAIYQQENLIYSPLSLNFALALISEGASNSAKADFEKYFGVGFEQYVNFYRSYLNSLSDSVEIANAYWAREGLDLTSSFKEAAKKDFQAETGTFPFDDAFVERVNNWCYEKTHGMIQDILEQPPEGKAIAINALYFKDQWAQEYSEDSIYQGDFTLIDGSKVTLPFLMSEEGIYLENEHAIGFIKAYGNERYSFIGILPNELGDFKFSDLDLKTLIKNQSSERVVVRMPEFEFESGNDLTNVVRKIGLESTMESGAFPEIIKNEDLLISAIFQKAKIKLDRNGTEAAAVTIIENDTASIDEKPIKVVELNRPFAFMIYDNKTGTVLFIGKVINPAK